MATFLWAVESPQPPTPESLAALGFPFPDLVGLPGGVATAPWGRCHIIGLSDGVVSGKSPTLDMSRLTWKRAGGYRIGWETDSPPTPAELQRKQIVSGYWVPMRDGNQWIVPAARRPDGTPGLPTTFGLDDDGKPARNLASEFDELWEIAKRIWDTLYVDTDAEADPNAPEPLTDDECLSAVAKALGVNYVISEPEIRALELCANAELITSVRAICDASVFDSVANELAKKNDGDNGPSECVS